MQAFENDGALLVDLHLDPDLLDRAEAAWDRFDRAEDATPLSIFEDRDYVELISAPVFEQIAKQVLRSDRVFILETGRAGTGLERGDANDRAQRNDWPEKHGVRSEWANSMHIDVRRRPRISRQRRGRSIWLFGSTTTCPPNAPQCACSRAATSRWEHMAGDARALKRILASAAAARVARGRRRARRPPVAGLEPTAMAAPRGYAGLLAVSVPRRLAFRRCRTRGIPHLMGRRWSEH